MADESSKATEVGAEAIANVAAAAAALAAGPTAGIVAAGAAPAVSVALQSALERWRVRRHEKVARTLEMASSQSGISADELVTKLASDPMSLDLLAEALDAAARSGISEKLKALADVLTRTVASQEEDPPVVDRARVIVGILRDLEAAHVAVLGYLEEDPERPGHGRLASPWAVGRIPEAAPSEHTIAVLRGHGLVREVTPDELLAGPNPDQRLAQAGLSATSRDPGNVALLLTPLGAECLNMLRQHT